MKGPCKHKGGSSDEMQMLGGSARSCTEGGSYTDALGKTHKVVKKHGQCPNGKVKLPLDSSDPSYIPQSEFPPTGMLSGVNSGECTVAKGALRQWKYPHAMLNDDKRVRYKNSKFPFVIAASTFNVMHKNPQQSDVARMQIPKVHKDP